MKAPQLLQGTGRLPFGSIFANISIPLILCRAKEGKNQIFPIAFYFHWSFLRL